VTFYRLILLIDIFIFLVVTAVCLFFIKVLQQQQLTENGIMEIEIQIFLIQFAF